MIRFRRRFPPAERGSSAFLTPGYPVFPILFIAASALVLAGVVRVNPKRSAIGAALIAAGLPVYYAYAGRATQGTKGCRDARVGALHGVGQDAAAARDRSGGQQSPRLHARRPARSARRGRHRRREPGGLRAPRRRHRRPVRRRAENVATANGCSGANFLACAALLEPGDEVLVERPFYDPMPAAARLLGASVATFERRFEDGYDVDRDRVAAALTPRTRLILISNPHNPSGALARPESLATLGALAARRGIHVLVDEVYLDTVFDGRPAPAATLSPAFVSTNSLTKAYGLASLRCGWTLAAPDLTRRIRRARDLVDVWAPMPSDRLSVLAFANLDALAARARGIVEPNRAAVQSWLAGRRDLACVPSRATIAFPR